ncbi:Spy/CpxP family protein refolding chaperone [Falsiroseomonas sp. HC035]|uniref:Spy/CpxP family protein refolding chaperone n=1 Tax=Falsiroseomonas sp. HC035 TaxID=3390999 RepID=UPI003D313B99
MRRLVALAFLFALPAAAQHAHHHPHASPAAQPYAGMQARAIKAISPEQAADLLAGRGMALALAAELNFYPGPMHVLEHAEALALTPDQRAEAARLRDAMAAEARALGARILALEAELDALFAGGRAEAGPLAALTAALGGLTGRLREVHLTAHIGMRAALTPAQRATYARLRGYAPP